MGTAANMTTEEFLSSEIAKTQAELGVAILNRGRWDALREDRRMLLFLQRRAGSADIESVAAELRLIADGPTRGPDIDGPRRKAAACLSDWKKKLTAN